MSFDLYLVLLQVGLTLPTLLPAIAVRSYRTFSPLPTTRRFIFCGTCRKLALPRSYLALCPTEPGLSSNDLVSSVIAWPSLNEKFYYELSYDGSGITHLILKLTANGSYAVACVRNTFESSRHVA